MISGKHVASDEMPSPLERYAESVTDERPQTYPLPQRDESDYTLGCLFPNCASCSE